jgi:predicted GNAT family acetyltransferase
LVPWVQANGSCEKPFLADNVNFPICLCRTMKLKQVSLLDNPTWNALSTIQASFAEGNELAKRYPIDVAPFAATRDQSSESYDSLAQLLGPTGTAALTFVAVPDFPAGWTIVRMMPFVQMVWNRTELLPVKRRIEDLSLLDVEEMLALVELTKPGPFSKRTPVLGSYLGIREAGQLVAMAGERRRLLGYTEISAVCTRPESRGRGYSSSLVSTLIQKIIERGETPFLHVRTENVQAIRVYEKLGFKTRRIINIAVVKTTADPAPGR